MLYPSTTMVDKLKKAKIVPYKENGKIVNYYAELDETRFCFSDHIIDQDEAIQYLKDNNLRVHRIGDPNGQDLEYLIKI